jgi:hypothetical protein
VFRKAPLANKGDLALAAVQILQMILGLRNLLS